MGHQSVVPLLDQLRVMALVRASFGGTVLFAPVFYSLNVSLDGSTICLPLVELFRMTPLSYSRGDYRLLPVAILSPAAFISALLAVHLAAQSPSPVWFAFLPFLPTATQSKSIGSHAIIRCNISVSLS